MDIGRKAADVTGGDLRPVFSGAWADRGVLPIGLISFVGFPSFILWIEHSN
jgi:hypothetical protein